MSRVIVESSGLPANVFAAECPARRALDHIAGKWTVLIIDALLDHGTLRYTDLRKRIDGISQKMLTQTLRTLQADGFVHRTMHPTIPPRVDYALTPLGRSLAEPLDALRRWTEEHINEVERARVTAE
ncbi:MAG TPA: helix-turn-helix domain-containing protein [Stackebrandtia sp.]|uniref:winged helix-turn-helix transcriptional regulator n=1 Tax=Stackebrandtia sp. TaxID=2023065 RepID=UPI002D4C98E3|nr:helix-turn-helix domain-containing protein [Stackebrandtia sp.]HZE37987.1 helix-turn-helix domain-containing protein [Stackebrandtia sp.]